MPPRLFSYPDCWRPLFFLGGFLLLLGAPVQAARPLFLRPGTASYLLGGAHLDILEDSGGTLTIDEVTAPEMVSRFRPNSQHIPNFGWTDSAFWLRFILVGSPSGGDESWLLLFDQPLADQVDLYARGADGVWTVLHSGDTRPMSVRPRPGHHILFPLTVPEETQTFYLRTQLAGRAQMPVTILTVEQMRQMEWRRGLFFGVYSGVVACITLVVLLIYLLLREREYLLFAIFIVSLWLSQVGMYGYLYLLVPAALLPTYNGALLLLWPFPVWSAVWFARSFLKTPTRIPRIDTVIKWLAILNTCMLVTFFYSELLCKQLLNLGMAATTLAVIVAATVVWRQGVRAAGYFLLARLMMCLAVFLFFLSNHGFIFWNFMRQPILIYASLLHILFIVIAMGDRFRVMRNERDATMVDLHAEIAGHSAANQTLKDEIAWRMRLERDIVLVSDRERQRISYELHDGLCQQLTGARLRCAVLEESLPKESEGLKEVRPLATLLDDAVKTAYDLSRGSWPLDAKAPVASLSFNAWSRRIAEQFGVELHAQCRPGCTDRCADHLGQVYRIAGEAIVNAAKHSGGTVIEVVLSCSVSDGILLRVRDNGAGLRSKEKNDGGMGIEIMRHRAMLIGGTLQIAQADGGGTQVICTAPCGGTK